MVRYDLVVVQGEDALSLAAAFGVFFPFRLQLEENMGIASPDKNETVDHYCISSHCRNWAAASAQFDNSWLSSDERCSVPYCSPVAC
mmetsp:Transcript_17402/g.25238  ORF Transcript_17402/g.25238 Transcript_17402/m.25238 type:complete len:87 (-) Transcript_17402:114-374(-)